MSNLFRQNVTYFSCLFIYLIIVGILLLNINKGDAVLFLNKNHNAVLDAFFYYITYLGDGRFAVAFILVIILFKNIFEGIVYTVSVLGTFLSVQFLKIFIFTGSPRPSAFFSTETELHFVRDLEIHLYNSFPSGHSGQVFAIFLIVSLFSKKKNLSYAFFILALMASLSRVYLAQHFLIDTYIGAIIASVVSVFTYIYFMNYTKLSSNNKLNRRLLS